MKKILLIILSVILISVSAVHIIDSSLRDWSSIFTVKNLRISPKSGGKAYTISLIADGDAEGSTITGNIKLKNVSVVKRYEDDRNEEHINLQKVSISASSLYMLFGKVVAKEIVMSGVSTNLNTLIDTLRARAEIASNFTAKKNKIIINDIDLSVPYIVSPKHVAKERNIHIKTLRILNDKSSGTSKTEGTIILGGLKYTLKDSCKLIDGRAEHNIYLSTPEDENIISVALKNSQKKISASINFESRDMKKLLWTFGDLFGIKTFLYAKSNDKAEGQCSISSTTSLLKIEKCGMYSKNSDLEFDLSVDHSSNFSYIKVRSEKLNLDDLGFEESAQIKHDLTDADMAAIMKPDLGLGIFDYLALIMPENSDLSADVFANNIVYHNLKTEDFRFTWDIQKGSTGTANMSVTLPGQKNSLQILGKTTKQSGRMPKFEGKLMANGYQMHKLLEMLNIKYTEGNAQQNNQEQEDMKTKFLLNSEFYMSPNIIDVKTFKLTSDIGSITGRFTLKTHLYTNALEGILEVKDVDFERYKINTFDLTSQYINSLLKNINYDCAIKSVLNRVKISGEFFNEISTNFRSIVHKGLLLPDIKVNGTASNFSGSASLLISEESTLPELMINIVGDRYGLDTLPKLSPLMEEDKGSQQAYWSTEKFNLDIIRNFSGEVNVSIKKAVSKIRKTILDDLVCDLSLRDGVIRISKISYKIGEGEVLINGNVSVNDKSEVSIKIGFLAENCLVELALPKNILYKNFISGVFNIAGNIKSSGSTPIQFAENLNGKIAVAGTKIEMRGLNIPLFLNKIFYADDKGDIASAVSVYLSHGSTMFETAKNNIEIKDGIAKVSGNFLTKNASGVLSANASIPQLFTKALVRLYFFLPNVPNRKTAIDLTLSGKIYSPEVQCDNEKLYSISISNRKYGSGVAKSRVNSG